MSKTLTASDRIALIRLASSLPKGSDQRKAILSGLQTVDKVASTMTEDEFNSLRPGTRLMITYSSVMAGSGDLEFEVGRTAYSKKYDVYSKRLYLVRDGKLIKGGNPYTLRNRKGNVSLAFGDLSVQLKSFKKL